MGTGWRRAFCTSIRRDPEKGQAEERHQSPSPRSCARLGFFSGVSGGSNHSTPRLQSHSLDSSPKLRCRTKSPASAAQDSPRTITPSSRSPSLPLQGPSNPSSPRSPSRFALLKTSLRLSRSRCGVCLQSVKTGQGTAIFTAECAHAFHFPCVAAHVRRHGRLVCPVCGATWRQVPLLSVQGPCLQHSPSEEEDGLGKGRQEEEEEDKKDGVEVERVRTAPMELGRKTRAEAEVLDPTKSISGKTGRKVVESKAGPDSDKVYDDDEPLLAASGCGGRAARFIPIPEADDEDEREGDGGEEFQGFFSTAAAENSFPCKTWSSSPSGARARAHLPTVTAGGDIHVSILPDVALLSHGRSHEIYAVALKVKAPPPLPPASTRSSAPSPLLHPSRRAPIDLVTVLDVSESMTGSKLHMLKRAMRLVVSSLGPADRLSIVVFSATAKRLLPLRRMSPQGQRSARRMIDRLVCGHGACVANALRKATKVLEDRRERNPVASIMLLSDGQKQQQPGEHNIGGPGDGSHWRRHITVPSSSSSSSSSSTTTRFAHLEIPVHASGFGSESQQHTNEPAEDAFAKCVGGLLSVVLQEVHIQLSSSSGEITAVYSCGRRPAVLGGLGGSLRLGDMYAEEERELLVELRVPVSCSSRPPNNLQHSMSVKCCFKDPASQEVVSLPDQALPLLLPVPHSHGGHGDPPLPSSSPKVEQLRNLFITTRAVVDAWRLAEHGEFSTSLHLLASARSLLLQSSSSSSSSSADENLRRLDAGLAEVQWLRQQRRRGDRDTPSPLGGGAAEDGAAAEQLTPTSAWRAAERLAKVAIMRKSLSRVSDLHGFENARF